MPATRLAISSPRMFSPAGLFSQRVARWPLATVAAVLVIECSPEALAGVARLAALGIRPKRHNFLSLRSQGYAVRKADSTHELTAFGALAAAAALARVRGPA